MQKGFLIIFTILILGAIIIVTPLIQYNDKDITLNEIRGGSSTVGFGSILFSISLVILINILIGKTEWSKFYKGLIIFATIFLIPIIVAYTSDVYVNGLSPDSKIILEEYNKKEAARLEHNRQYEILQKEKEREREIIEKEKERERIIMEEQEANAIRNDPIKFPVTDKTFEILSDDKLEEKLLYYLTNYKGEDNSGTKLLYVMMGKVQSHCGISDNDAKKVSGSFTYYKSYKLYKNEKYVEISLHPRFVTENDEFSEYNYERLCVTGKSFGFNINLENGEVNRIYGDKNAKIILDYLS